MAETADYGSFVLTGGEYQEKVKLEGLSADVSKLPHDVATGSMAFCVDTGDCYIFHRPSDTWYKQ